MRRRILFVCVVALGVAQWTQAGVRDFKGARPAALVVDDGVQHNAQPGKSGGYIPGLDNATSLTWVAVDLMGNAFGPASTRVRPIVYDPATNVLAVMHRGDASYATGSGQLWYNISFDGGATWRRVGELNGGAPIDCRYPNAAISNPANSTDTNQCLFVYAAPNLQNAGGWGLYTYGVDFPLGGGAGSGIVDTYNMGDNSAAASIWSPAGSSWIVWAATAGTTSGGANDSRVWRTNDYVTVESFIPSTWTDAEPNFVNAISYLPGMANATGDYFGMHGVFGYDTTAVAFNGGYSKSTDHGATWSQWVRPSPDWMQATGLPPRFDLYDYVQPAGSTVSYNSDMIVDDNGRVHFVHVVVDSPWTEHDMRGLLEVYETAQNVWAYKWITQGLNTYTGLGYPGVVSGTTYMAQTNNGIRTAVSSDGQMLAAVWLDAGTSAPADSFPDIWFSYRATNGSAWSTPVNLTQTPGFPELLLHAAPILKSEGDGRYTIFIGRTYQTGINTYPPDNGLTSTFYVASHTFGPVASVQDPGNRPTAFALEQNYPNPFNPATSIGFTTGRPGHVTLKVYNLLGEELATLVNEDRPAGTYRSSFDATSLASGVYLYRLTVGSYSESKRMVLLR
jgi:hypothetical protein